MALVTVSPSGAAPITLLAAAAPTTSETITNPDHDTWLEINVGGTATTVTVVRPGTHEAGDAAADLTIGPLTSTNRLVRIGEEYTDTATGTATVTFSQVTAVTARLWRF